MKAWVLAALAILAPGRVADEVAEAIAYVVESSPALFADDIDKAKTLAFVTAVAWRESSFKANAIGDQGRAKCFMQLWNVSALVLTDPLLCARIGMDRLRESFRACGKDNVLGVFAAGPKGCASAVAKRISADRLWLSRNLLKEVKL